MNDFTYHSVSLSLNFIMFCTRK